MKTKPSHTKGNLRLMLRNRIVKILSAKLGRSQGRPTLEEMADQVLELFEKRVKAPDIEKGKVWRAGEQEILQSLRS